MVHPRPERHYEFAECYMPKRCSRGLYATRNGAIPNHRHTQRVAIRPPALRTSLEKCDRGGCQRHRTPPSLTGRNGRVCTELVGKSQPVIGPCIRPAIPRVDFEVR